MKFNIKNWQDKHLIKESKGLKREIDFKSDDAFKKYNAKHKMRATTKVNIAGKDTTAGDATGDGKSASKSVAPSKNGKDLSDLVNNSLADFGGEDYEEEAMERLDQLFQDTGAYDKEELTYEDGMKAIQDLDNYQDGESYHNDEDEAYDEKIEMQGQLMDLFDPNREVEWNDDTRGNVKADGSSHDYEELSRTTKTSQTGRFDDDDDDDDYDDGDDDYDDGDDDYDDGDDYDDDDSDPEDILANAKVAYENGLMDKEEWDNTREDYDDDDEYSDEALGSDGYFWANDDAKADHEKQSGTKQDTDAADGPAVPVSGKQSSTARIGSDHLSNILSGMDGDASGYYDDGGETGLIDHMEKAFDKAGLFDYPDGPDGERDMGVTYQGISDAIDAYDGLENENNPETGEKWTPEDIKSDKEYFKSQMRDELDQAEKDREEDEANESVIPRSTRIQEARMYQTIQQLKGLEKN